MGDPVSVAAIAGLIYAGRKLSHAKEMYEPQPEVSQPTIAPPPPVFPEMQPREYPGSTRPNIDKQAMESFADLSRNVRSSGQEVLEMRNRMYDVGRMNNVGPIEKRLVGPGLGVDPNVPSYGGHQQLLRVNPENVGAYRLTTLPGRSGPAQDVSGGRRGVAGGLYQNRPETTAFLPDRLPNVAGKSQGFGGRTPRGEHEKTKKITNRAATGLRTDTLSVAPAKRFVSNGSNAQDPTRNKKDGNIEQYQYMNNPQPGINSFQHGYLQGAAVAMGENASKSPHTPEQMFKYGFRPDERRGKAGRPAGPGRMNVRAGPLNQGGKLTAVRSDTTRLDGRVNPQAGGWTQQYDNSGYYDLNAYKDTVNPNASPDSLNVAKRQLARNPLSHQLS